MQTIKNTARTPTIGHSPVLPARPRLLRPVKAVQVEEQTTTTTSEGQEIYIGFPKGDYAPRAGRKGRVIVDDPKKYPGREDLGPIPSVVGGWAGGEVGLWQLRDAVKAEQTKTSPAAKKAAPTPAPSSGSGEAIYVGFSKDELELRKSGAKGRVIFDDPSKYPGKEDIGFLSGATGGFAGGEAGIKAFVATGEVRLRKPGEPGSRQSSPVALGLLLVLLGSAAGVIYANGEGLIKAPIDDSTKTMLMAAIGLIGVTGAIAGGRTAVKAVQERLKASQEVAQQLVVKGAFYLAVFLAACAVLELELQL